MEQRSQAGLAGLISAASALIDPEELASVAVSHVRQLVGADASELYWWDDAEHVLTPLATADPTREPPDPPVHPGQGMIGVAFEHRREQVVGDYRADVPGGLAYARRRSVACVPLIVRDEPKGVLTAVRYEVRPFDDDDLDLLRLIGGQVTPALLSMRLLAQAKRRAAEARALGDLLVQGASEADPDAVLALIARHGCRLLGADVCGLALADPDGRPSTWVAVYGERTDAWRELVYPPGSWRERVLFSDAAEPLICRRGDPELPIASETVPFLDAEGADTGLALPLRVDGRVIGTMEFGWRFEHVVRPRHVDFGSVLAGFAAVLAERARQAHMLSALVEEAPIILGATDANGVITLSQGRALGALSVEQGGLVGRHVETAFADSPELLRTFRQAGRSGPQALTLDYRGRTFDAYVVARAGGGLLVATDVTERRQAEDALRHEATHDRLTGLVDLREAVARTRALLQEGPANVLRFDVRDFDDINETVGYDAGDAVLQAIARRLERAVPPYAVIARTGGDEFALVTPGVPEDLARAAALVQELMAPPLEVGGEAVPVSVRVGAAPGEPGCTADRALRRADTALQRARRDDLEVVVWDEAFDGRRRAALALTSGLRRAIARGELELAYQPIVDLQSGRPVRAEALLRWTPVGGDPVPASDMIDVAERSGLIGSLTAWVLDTALAQAAAWRAAGGRLPVAVNVSAADLVRGDLPELVEGTLRRHGLDPEALVVEVTETAFVEPAHAARAAASALRAQGVGLSIDDFGTGWSSLAQLKRLPATELKVDRSFVAEMRSDPRDQAVVESALRLGEAFDVEVVAEGIEDAETAERLRTMGCRLGQGWHFGRPGAPDALR